MPHQRTPVAIAVVEQRDRFLVGRRPEGKPLAGYWEFPGGRVERGETAAEAAVRECLEETGIAVAVIRQYPGGAHNYAHDSIHLSFFACRPTSDGQTPRAPFVWVTRGELPLLQFPEANRDLLRRLAAEGRLSPRLLVPEEPLPRYSYVPNKFPHPIRDPQGHSHGREAELPGREVQPSAWAECRSYLRGIDLFNHGYYWEAHEAWESVWHAAGRAGATADFLKGLIKLAAALVKAREGRRDGVARHAIRASELFAMVLAAREPSTKFMGLDVQELGERARLLAQRPDEFVQTSSAPVVRLVDFVLVPE